MVTQASNKPILDTTIEWWTRRKWLFLVSFLFVVTLVVSLVKALPPLYRASTTMLFSQEEMAESLVSSGGGDQPELRLAAIRQEVMSRSQLQEVIEKFGLYPDLGTNAPPEAAVNRLRNAIEIQQRASAEPRWDRKSTYIITISFRHWDPKRAAQIANELAARFQDENRRIRTARATRATGFIGEQLETARSNFITQQERINAFRDEHLEELPEQRSFNLSVLERLYTELRQNEERQQELLEARDDLLGADGAGPAGDSARLTGPMRRERLERELAALQTRYTDNHPDIIRLREQIEELKNDDSVPSGRNNGANLEQKLADLRRNQAQLRNEIANLTATIEATPKTDQELKRLTYDYDVARDAYLSLQKLYREAQITESLERQENPQFKVVESAIPPSYAVAPNRGRLMTMGFVVAVGFAVLVVFLAEQLDNSFHSPAEIQRFTRVPVLATIGRIPSAGDSWRRRTRFAVTAVFVAVGLLMTAGVSHYVGSNAQQLVWRISN